MPGRPTIEQDVSQFLQRLRDLGPTLSNGRLKEELGWLDDRYWRTHGIVVDSGEVIRGKGQGGSVTLAEQALSEPIEERPASPETAAATARETDLYEDLLRTVQDVWVKERTFDDAVAEITAMPGRKKTGGAWTRPDLGVLATKTYPYLPGRSFEIITFEVNRANSADVKGVFEALSHSQFATSSYVLFCTEGIKLDLLTNGRILDMAKRHGVGIIMVIDQKRYDTWNEVAEPRRNLPDPEQANTFIGACFSNEAKLRVVSWQK